MPQGRTNTAKQAGRNSFCSGLLFLAIAILSALLVSSDGLAQEERPRMDGDAVSPWYRIAEGGALEVNLYVFWSERCPHCRRAMAFLAQLQTSEPWLALHPLEVSQSEENAALYESLARQAGAEARYVPAFFFCGSWFTGYDRDETTGTFLRNSLMRCRSDLTAALAGDSGAASNEGEPVPVEGPAMVIPPIEIPLVGALDPAGLSLPVLTVVLGGLDSFNPCAFFVLLFLLSFMVHARSRPRMLLVGGIFVAFSGLIYFLFMTAWLNLFLVIGHVQAVTLLAGAVAVTIGLLNIKDYVRFGQGPSLAIPEAAKPGLIDRMRALVGASSLPAMLGGTVMLAIAANAYELLCTAGFPMVFTRILTLHELSPFGRYLFLALYNLVYVIPLLVIVAIFAVTLGSRKLQESEGRVLKLLSGLMMLSLGLLLLVEPAWLDSFVTALLLVVLSVGATFLIVLFTRNLKPRREFRQRH